MLTNLGAQQLFQVGTDYRARYLASDSPHRIQGISEFEYVPAQIYASAPDQSILLNTATSFLQGLYPPLNGVDQVGIQELANGSSVSTPLSGYQYVTLHGIDEDAPDTVWIKGDDFCPVVANASADFMASTEYKSMLASTRDYYRSIHHLVADVFPSADDLSYAKAYTIFDLVNVQHVHNATSPAANVTAADLFQLRTLADSAEFGLNYNASEPTRSLHAQTLAGAVWSHLNDTISTKTMIPKFSLLAGSYDTFLAFFGVADLASLSTDFHGLPDYASTMTFEVFTPTNATFTAADARVRFLFRNGTAGSLTAFPLFGSGKADLSWDEFTTGMQARGISTVEGWCDACKSTASFCAVYNDDVDVVANAVSADSGVSKGSWIAVVVVMAVALAGNAIWAALWLVRSRRERAAKNGVIAPTGAGKEVSSVRSRDGESV